MSKYGEIIDMVDSIRPNPISKEMKLWWLVTLDGKIAVELMLMGPEEVKAMLDYEEPEAALDREALVSFPYEEIYQHYLEAKLNYTAGEYNEYGNTMQAFNAAYNSYANWFLNTYDPAQGYRPEMPRGGCT